MAFIAPGILAFNVLREPGEQYPPIRDSILYFSLVAFGVVGGIIGTAASLSGLAKHQDQC